MTHTPDPNITGPSSDRVLHYATPQKKDDLESSPKAPTAILLMSTYSALILILWPFTQSKTLAAFAFYSAIILAGFNLLFSTVYCLVFRPWGSRQGAGSIILGMTFSALILLAYWGLYTLGKSINGG